MGTTAQKLTYLNDTKSLLKDSINSLGGNITSQTTFRQYATELDSIYSNLPKVSGTGSSISLTPTLKGRLGSVLKGNTYQFSTTGKNLFHNTLIATATEYTGVMVTPNSDGSVTLNGTATANTYVNLDNYNYDVVIGTLTDVSTARKSASSNNYTISCYIDNGTLLNVAYDNGNKFSYIRLKSGQTYNNSKVYLQIEASSSMTDYEPYTGGTASPNPDYPQEIQSATGLQKVSVEGKNLYNINNFSISSWDTGGGNYTSKVDNTILTTSDFTIYRSKCVEIPNLKKNTDYVLSGNLKSTNTNGGKVVIYGYNGSSTTQIKANDGTLSVGDFSLSFNSGNYTNIGISFNGVGGSTSKETIFENIQIEKGTTATEYEPYQSQEYEINLGKNLFDENNVSFTTGILDDNGNPTASTSSHYTNEYYNVIPNTNYNLSGTLSSGVSTSRIYFYDRNKNWLSRTTSLSGDNITFKTPNNCYFIRIQVNIEISLQTHNVQLEQGTQATSYSEYFTPIHLRKSKDGTYSDYIQGLPNNWSIKRQIGSIVLNGTEPYGNDGLVSTVRRYTLPLTNVKLNDSTNPKLSNYFKYVFNYNLDEPHFYITNSGTLYIFSNYTDGTQFKNWLSTAKPEFEYPLATETTEVITNQEIINQLNEIYYLQSYNGTTNITITSADLELIMTASALKGE